MAVRDFIDYYRQEEAQYNEMLSDAKDLEDSYRAGRISEDQYDKAIDYIESIRLNHERLAYVMFLLTKRKKYAKRASIHKAEVLDNQQALSELNKMKEGN